jgi:hypothetical protein
VPWPTVSITSPESLNTNFSVIAASQAATGATPSYAQFQQAVGAVRHWTQGIPGLFNSLTASNSSYSAANLYLKLLNRAPTASDGSCATAAGKALESCKVAFFEWPAIRTD